jgi:hypothetical protein
MTMPNTPGYVPTGAAPQVAWDPDDHAYKVMLLGAAELEPHAVTATRTIRVGSNPSTTSGTFADIPDMIDTTTTGGPDAVTVDLLVMMAGVFAHSAVNVSSFFALQLDGGSDLNAGAGFAGVASTGLFGMSTIAIFQNVPPGAHTVKGRWYTISGTLFISATRCWLDVVELRR